LISGNDQLHAEDRRIKAAAKYSETIGNECELLVARFKTMRHAVAPY
jgi:hypothetical protein